MCNAIGFVMKGIAFCENDIALRIIGGKNPDNGVSISQSRLLILVSKS